MNGIKISIEKAERHGENGSRINGGSCSWHGVSGNNETGWRRQWRSSQMAKSSWQSWRNGEKSAKISK